MRFNLQICPVLHNDMQSLQKDHLWPTQLHGRKTKRIFHPCVHCGYTVSGAYQCGKCWGNIHIKCGKSLEFGKANPRVCKWCIAPSTPVLHQGPLYNPPPSVMVGPDRLYISTDERALRRRLFPCPTCGLAADGQHQCLQWVLETDDS
jgi:hypothetical protein